MATFRLTTNDDNISGTPGSDILEVPNNNANLVGTDIVALGAGHDVALFERSSAIAFSYERMAGFSGIDELDATAGSSAFFSVSDDFMSQSDSNTLTFTFDGDPFSLDLRDLSAGFGNVILNGTGQVALFDANQAVQMATGISGHVTGGTFNDSITGSTANDVFTGGDGEDVLSGGTGANTVTGGDGFDRFVVSQGESLTVTDFAGNEGFEQIDLRAFAGLNFGDLTITNVSGNARVTLTGGTTVNLAGVAAGTLSDKDFLFAGQTESKYFVLLEGPDNFVGGAGDDVVEFIGSSAQLSAAEDNVNGGAGIDTLLVYGSNRSLGPAFTDALTSIEIIDLTNASGTHEVTVSASHVASAEDGIVTIKFGNSIIGSLDTATIGSAEAVVLEGAGSVTLRDIAGQGITISDNANGTVIGQNKNDTILGGNGNDVISGSGGHDTLKGGAGNDTIDGGEGSDEITAGTGTNQVTGGDGTDRFIITPGETVTITDFGGSATYEFLDLRALAGVSFGDLTITANGGNARVEAPDGSVIILSGVAAGTLSAADFVMPGQDTPMLFTLTDGADVFTGGSAADVFDLLGTISQLDANVDVLNGGAGIDVLRINGEDRVLGEVRLDALNRVEVVDLTNATGTHDIAIDAANANSSDTGALTVRFGNSPMFLNTGGVTSASQVILDGSGLVTLSSGTPGQMLTIGDNVGGNIQTGNDATVVIGGALGDTVIADEGDDTIIGNGGNDSLRGGEGNDSLEGGEGNDTLEGGSGNDILVGGRGANRLDGGEGYDQYVIEAGAGGTVIADYDPDNFVERIDLTALTSLRGLVDLTFTNEGANVRITGTGLNIVLENVQANQLNGADFLFQGQDPRVYNVQAGTTNAQLQQLFDGAIPDAIINISAGTYSITETLEISRGDITVKGAGEGETIFRTDIGIDNPGPTILVHPESLQDRYGQIGLTMAEGSNQLQLPDVDALRTANPALEFDDFKVGDLVFLFQENDDAYLEASGNLNNPDGLADWNAPQTDPADPTSAELYYLREFRSRIVSIDENGVATLAEVAPYTFEAGKANIAKNTFLENVHLSDFSIQGNFEDDAGGAPDPFYFEDTIPEWVSIAALEFDGVRDSSMERITITDPAAHAFKWQRAHETTADALTAVGAHNKSGSSGYHFLFQESFANDFTNLSSTDARHAVLFSSYNAEHYNTLHMLYTNRDINFHGSPDDENTIVIDVNEQDYPVGSSPQWQAVHPGVRGLHPLSDIEGNDVTFKYARSGDRSDRIVAHEDGGNIAMRDGSDLGLGQGGNDTMNGDDGNDTLQGYGGDDKLNGGEGKDTLAGGVGNDTLRGGNDNDLLVGGSGDDVINGGANGDDLYGGAGSDTFLRLFEDFTDTIYDFEAGVGGDVIRIRGSAYTAFSQLNLRQVGADVIVDFGPTGYTELKGIQLADLVSANFAFEGDNAPGQTIEMRATQLFAVGTDKGDIFTASRAHVDSPDFKVLGGTGFDVIKISQSSLNANLGEIGTFTGIEGFDVSGIETLGLVVENPLVSQSNSSKLYIDVGDPSAGNPVLLDVGPLGRGKNVFIDGSREVQLTGGREHTVKSDDDVGTNIVGDVLRDIIYGGRANDSILGGDGNDVLFGSAGDDTLQGQGGNDTLNGGPGSDLLIIDDAGDRVAESNRWDGHDTVQASVDFRMGRAHIEDLVLTGDAILGAGNGLRNVITGNDQDNILDGGKNVDTLVGGDGNDTYLLRAPGDNAVELEGGGIDTVRAFRSIQLDANVENLYIQTLRNDAGEGVPGVNGIGNELNNTIVGNPFDNSIIGREGRDTLRGQAGADSFVFDRALAPDNVDRIIDFNVNEADEGDKLMMKQTVFAGVVKGILSADAFVAGTAALDADDRFIFDQVSGQLWFDIDGTGAQDQQLIATFEQNALVTASDIELF